MRASFDKPSTRWLGIYAIAIWYKNEHYVKILIFNGWFATCLAREWNEMMLAQA